MELEELASKVDKLQKGFGVLWDVWSKVDDERSVDIETIRHLIVEAGVCGKRKYDQVKALVLAESDQKRAAIRERAERILREHGMSLDDL